MVATVDSCHFSTSKRISVGLHYVCESVYIYVCTHVCVSVYLEWSLALIAGRYVEYSHTLRSVVVANVIWLSARDRQPPWLTD